MKKIVTVFFLLLFCGVIICVGVSLSGGEGYHNTYLRIHIRANSNGAEDQNIKYQIKDAIVSFLTPVIANCTDKAQFIEQINKNIENIECISNNILAQNNFNYLTDAKVNTEYFPIRSYENLTLENGYYDALIINLGSGKGDNWWCVVYPPLCFLNTNTDYIYKSRIVQIIESFFGG